jgi:hypothetical protein
MARKMRKISYEELHASLRIGSVVGIARALDLPKRLPEYFKRRGWPLGDDEVFGTVVRAIASVKLGALAEPIGIPVIMRRFDKWSDLGIAAESSRIVSVLDLGRFLEP